MTQRWAKKLPFFKRTFKLLPSLKSFSTSFRLVSNLVVLHDLLFSPFSLFCDFWCNSSDRYAYRPRKFSLKCICTSNDASSSHGLTTTVFGRSFRERETTMGSWKWKTETVKWLLKQNEYTIRCIISWVRGYHLHPLLTDSFMEMFRFVSTAVFPISIFSFLSTSFLKSTSKQSNSSLNMTKMILIFSWKESTHTFTFLGSQRKRRCWWSIWWRDTSHFRRRQRS